MAEAKKGMGGCAWAAIIVIAFIVVVVGGGFASLYYFGFVQRGGVYDGLRRQLTQQELNEGVSQIEFYKTVHGEYPDDLGKLPQGAAGQGTMFINVDSTNPQNPRPFFYQRVGCDHYYLRSVGPDGQPFTQDDLTPVVAPEAVGKIGLLTVRDASQEKACKATPASGSTPAKRARAGR